MGKEIIEEMLGVKIKPRKWKAGMSIDRKVDKIIYKSKNSKKKYKRWIEEQEGKKQRRVN